MAGGEEKKKKVCGLLWGPPVGPRPGRGNTKAGAGGGRRGARGGGGGAPRPPASIPRPQGPPIRDALELALGQDAALHEVRGVTVRAPLDDPTRHAGGDARQLLDLPAGGRVEVDRR